MKATAKFPYRGLTNEQVEDARLYLSAIGGKITSLSLWEVEIEIPDYRSANQEHYLIGALTRLAGIELEVRY